MQVPPVNTAATFLPSKQTDAMKLPVWRTWRLFRYLRLFIL